MRKKIIAGNWKMNKNVPDSVKLAEEVVKGISSLPEGRIVVLCPPFTSLAKVGEIVAGHNGVFCGAQNMYFEKEGAYTGEISADMIRSCGADFVIIGHSERRQYFNESDEFLNKKAASAIEAGLTPIFCVGEKLPERESNRHFSVVKKQIIEGLKGLDLSKLVVAYEPVWAIGTGRTATPEIAEEMHEFIRKTLAEISSAGVAEGVSILYGGSVKSSNAKGLLEQSDIDGALVGGASLKADEFLKIIYYD